MLKYYLVLGILLIQQSVLLGQYRATEWADRDHWQNTEVILKNLDLSPGMAVADIGCHEGYLTMKLSPVVGDRGKVMAVDVEQYKLNKLARRLKQQNIINVKTILGDYDDPKLPLNSLDAVVILDAYHEMDDYQKILKHVYRALKPGGRLVMVEPIAKSRLQWTRKKQAGKHEIAMRYVLTDLKQAGFAIRSKKDPFIDRPSKNDRMWIAVAVKPKS
ncbi:MAG: class I SAM-dependent methyltransferase [Cyclobacteriaceae bacterium]|nr:class I SAM-dependent methyltransferase [Cyclobacteriaceae bacterium]